MAADPARPVILFASLGHALYHVLVGLFLTLVLVLEPVWQLQYDYLVGLWTAGALLVGLFAPIAGWLADRLGETRLMIVFFLGIGAAAILCGLADGPLALQVALALMGLFGSIYHPVGTAWVVKNATRRGRSIAVVGISGSIGAALASLIAGGIADLAGWRAAFILPGALTVGAGGALAVAYLSGWIADRDGDVAPHEEPDRADVWRAFAVLVVTMSLTTLTYHAFATMLPKWIDRELGTQLGHGLVGIGAVVTVIYLLGAMAQLVGGHYADRGRAKEVYVASFALKLAALFVASFVGGWSIVVAAIAIVFVFDIAAPTENVLIARYTPARRRGLAYGVRHGIAVIAAPLGVQLVARLFDQQAGFIPLLQVLAAIVLVILMAALWLPTDQRHLQVRQPQI